MDKNYITYLPLSFFMSMTYFEMQITMFIPFPSKLASYRFILPSSDLVSARVSNVLILLISIQSISIITYILIVIT